jgi:hypothetical protein
MGNMMMMMMMMMMMPKILYQLAKLVIPSWDVHDELPPYSVSCTEQCSLLALRGGPWSGGILMELHMAW